VFFVRSVAFVVGTAAGLSAQAPVMLESRVNSNGGGEAILTNRSSVPLTAYVIQVFLEPCSPTPRPAQFRSADVVLTTGQEPLAPSQSLTVPLGAAYCNKDGVSVPGRAELKAVLFQDGASFGEASYVNALLDIRRFELEQADIVLSRLMAAKQEGASRQDILADLERRLTVSNPTLALPLPVDLRELALNSLKGGTESSLPYQIDQTVTLFEELHKRLIESRPSLR
jgi:hypothetical protein